MSFFKDIAMMWNQASSGTKGNVELLIIVTIILIVAGFRGRAFGQYFLTRPGQIIASWLVAGVVLYVCWIPIEYEDSIDKFLGAGIYGGSSINEFASFLVRAPICLLGLIASFSLIAMPCIIVTADEEK